MSFQWCLVIAAILTLGTTTSALAALEKVVTLEGITEYRLDNGLQVLLVPDASRPTVTVNLTMLVGSRHEGYGETGMAHLLEHMLFKGTPTHPEIPKVLQERGASFNGTTWVDRTNYYETLPASQENLEFALRLEADRMMNSRIRREDLISEMTVVRNEFERGENAPVMILSQRMAAVAFEWHNYGKSTIGNRSDIEKVPVENLRAFYRKYYQPDNAVLVVAGRFDNEKALGLIDKYFGSIPRPKRKLPKTYTEEPVQDGERSVTLRRVGDVGVTGVVYHIPEGSHPDFPALEVLDQILTSEPSGRLYKALVQTKKAANVMGSCFGWHDPGVYEVLAEVRDVGTLPDVNEEIVQIVENIWNEGVTQEEVTRGKQQILTQRELASANTTRLAIQFSTWAAMGDWRLYLLHRDRVEKVTLEQVQQVAQRYFKQSNRTIGYFYPTKDPQRAEIPEPANLADIFKNYTPREEVAAGEVFDSSPENIEQRTVRTKFDNGLKVALLPKKTRGESVMLQLSLEYGNEENLRGYEVACELLPAVMMRGTKELTYQQLRDELDRNRATLSPSGSLQQATFHIETKQKNLSTVLDLLRQVLREPALLEEELAVQKEEILARYEAAKSDPQTLAVTDVRSRLSPYPKGDVRYVASVEEEIERVSSVTIDQLRALHGEFLSGAEGEISIVGDFVPETVLDQLHEIFDEWDAPQVYSRIKYRAFPDVPGQRNEILTPDKANAMYFAGFTLPMSDDNPDYPALVIGNYVLGAGSLSSRLGDRVRQQEGLSYGVASMFQARSLDPRAALSIYAISNPQNAPRVAEVILEEFQKLLDDGIDEEELQRAKQGYLQRQQVSRSNDNALASILNGTLYSNRTMRYYADTERRIAELTTEEVETALRKHFDPSRLVVTIAGDLEKSDENQQKNETGAE